MDALLDGLNPHQQRAVEHRGGPLLVLAGPGSGKTRVITRRLAHRIIVDAIPPERILALTFTNRAAQEMGTRVRALVGEDARLAIGTFHWAGHAILRRYSNRLGISRNFRLLTHGEARRVLRRALGDSVDARRAADIAAALSAWKNGRDPDAEAKRLGISTAQLRAAGATYDRELRALSALDLDDLLARTASLLRGDADVRARCRAAHAEILVDEYQDTNPVQREILRMLLPAGGVIVAVGDEDQGIYGWRGADSATMREFVDDFPGAALVKLEETYRNSKHILRCAGALIGHNQGRIGTSLRTSNPAGARPVCFAAGDEVEEAEWIAAEIERDRHKWQSEWNDFAVLYRINAQSRAIEDALLRRGIPYRVSSGYRFYDRPEIRRVVAYLRLALDAADDDAVGTLLEAIPGLGPKRLAAVRSVAPRGELLASLVSNRPSPLPPSLADRVTALHATVEQVRRARMSSLSDVVEAAIAPVASTLAEASPAERETALENLNELRSAAVELADGRGTLRGFLERFALAGKAEDRGEGVQLMSLHAAKGLEFPVVFLAGLEEGLLPHRRSLAREVDIEEERRLCYVGMTRARDRLYLSYAHARLLGGQLHIGQVSRFVGEMGRGNLRVRVSPAAATRPRLASVSVGDRVMHPRWRCGTVEAIQGAGRATMVTIAFDGGSRQRVQLCHAPLTRLKEEKPHVHAG